MGVPDGDDRIASTRASRRAPPANQYCRPRSDWYIPNPYRSTSSALCVLKSGERRLTKLRAAKTTPPTRKRRFAFRAVGSFEFGAESFVNKKACAPAQLIGHPMTNHTQLFIARIPHMAAASEKKDEILAQKISDHCLKNRRLTLISVL